MPRPPPGPPGTARLLLSLVVVSILGFGGCQLKDPHLVLEVRDDNAKAGGTTTLRVYHDFWETKIDFGDENFPSRMTLFTEQAGRKVLLWVDALDAGGATLARGNALVAFPASGTGSATVYLLAACGSSGEGDECAHGDTTIGTGRCRAGACVVERCGNGFVEGSEQCDDANIFDDDRCLSDCSNNICGDGNLNLIDETCDDGNEIDGDGCAGDCSKNEACGDGFVDAAAGEECDDGNENPYDACNSPPSTTDPEACRHRVWKPLVIAGTGKSNGDARRHRFRAPSSVAVSPQGDRIFVVDYADRRVLQLTRDDVFFDGTGTFPPYRVVSVAGTGESGFSGDGGIAGAASFVGPTDVAVDGVGSVYIVDRDATCVRRADVNLRISTVAGKCVVSGEIGSSLTDPIAAAVDGQGNLYIADYGGGFIHRIDANTRAQTAIAGGGGTDPTLNPMPTDALLAGPVGVGFDSTTGAVVFADRSMVCTLDCDYELHLYQFDPNDPTLGLVELTAGPTIGGVYIPEMCPTTTCERHDPTKLPVGITVDESGQILFSDPLGNRIYSTSMFGWTTHVAGSGTAVSTGDYGAPLDAGIWSPGGLAYHPQIGLLVADANGKNIRIMDILVGNVIDSLAGRSPPPVGEYSIATSAPFSLRSVDALGHGGLAVGAPDPILNLPEILVANANEHHVRRIAAPTDYVETIAGTGVQCLTDDLLAACGDGGAARTSRIGQVAGLDRTPSGDLIFAEAISGRVRRLIPAPDGTFAIDTLLDNVPTPLVSPSDLKIDSAGDYAYVYSENAIGRIDLLDGSYEKVAGNATCGGADCGDGGPALDAGIGRIGVLMIRANGDILVSDSEFNRVRLIFPDPGGTGEFLIEAYAGAFGACAASTPAACGDGGGALGVDFVTPFGLAEDLLGRVYIADPATGWVWRVDTDDSIHWVAGNGDTGEPSGDGGLATDATLGAPVRLAIQQSPVWGELLLIFAQHSLGSGLDYRASIRGLATDDSAGPQLIISVAGEILASGNARIDRSSFESPVAVVPTTSPYLWLVSDPPTGQIRMVELAIVPGAVRTIIGYPGGISNQPTNARFFRLLQGPTGLAWNPNALSVYISERDAHVIQQVDLSSLSIAILAGVFQLPGNQDNTMLGSQFRSPSGLAIDETNQILYVADTGNHVVRAIDLANDMVATLAGQAGIRGFGGDAGVPTDAVLNAPEALAIGPDGNIFIADTGNNRIRVSTPYVSDSGSPPVDTPVIDTIVGDGVASSSGRGVDTPRGISRDSIGNMYFTSRTTVRMLPYVMAIADSGPGGPARFDDPITIYGTQQPSLTFPELATKCLSGTTVLSDPVIGDWVLVLDACTGLVITLQPTITANL